MSELERLYEVLGQHRERVDIMRRRLDVATDADEPARRSASAWRSSSSASCRTSTRPSRTVLAILDESADDRDRAGDAGLAVRAQGRGQRAAGGAGAAAAAGGHARDPRPRSCAAWPSCWRDRWPGRPRRLDRWREVLELAADRSPGAGAGRGHAVATAKSQLALAAAQVLEPLYETNGEWTKLAGLIDLYINADEDSRERMHHRVRLAQLQEERLGDKPARRWTRTGRPSSTPWREPQLPELLDAYERLADGLGGDETRKRARAVPDHRGRRAVRRRPAAHRPHHRPPGRDCWATRPWPPTGTARCSSAPPTTARC